MSESKFTPAPWSIVPYGDGSSLVIHSDEDNRVCFMATASSDRPSSHASIRANARLIAAAPELFEQHEANIADLQMLRRAIEEGDPMTELLIRVDDLLKFSRAALAKAVPQ